MKERQRPPWIAYLSAVLLPAATVAVRLALGFTSGDPPAFILFLIPIVIAAWAGGLGPGLTATLVSALGADWFLVAPTHSLVIGSALASIQVAALVLGGALISLLAESKSRAGALQPLEHEHTGWLRTERRVQAVSVVTLACLGVMAVVSYQSVADLQRDITIVAHTHEVIGGLRALLATATDAETAQRGYTITGQESYLAPFLEAGRNVDGQVRSVRTLTSDNPLQQQRLALLAPLLTRRMTGLSDNVTRRRNEGFAAARALTASGNGKALQDSIRAVIGAMEATERSLLDARTARASGAGLRARTIILGGGVLAVLVVTLGLFSVSRDFVRRAAELARANESTRASEVQLRTIVENLAEGLVVSDMNGQVSHFNRAALALHGYASLDEARRHLSEFPDTFELAAPDGTVLPLDQWPLARVLKAEAFEDMRVRIRHLHAGWQRIFSYGGTLVRDDLGRPMMAVVSITDITETQRAEQEIRKLNAELEHRVEVRTAQLQAANSELEAFSYSVSHDLRSPLRTMDGFSQAVLDDYGTQLPEDGRRLLQTIRLGAQRMGALIDDLLAFAKLSRQPMHKQTVDMNRLVQSALDDLRREWNGRQIEVTVADLPPAQGDPALLAQVWQNLLSNAVKYTRQRDQAVIKVGATLENGRQVYSVQDNGIGFDMRYANKLFGVFQRLHRAEEFEGTGVGLAIVQRVVNRHGGRVWVDAAVDRGATFFLTLDGETTE